MSQARRRLALVTAALATLGAGALLAVAPAGADTKTVSYTCTSNSQSTPHQVTVNLSGGVTATAGSPYPATLVIAGATPSFTAVEAIPAGAQIQLVPQVSISATPTPASVPNVAATAAAPVPSALQPGAALTPIPTVTMTVTPQAGATSMVLSAGSFTLRVLQPNTTVGADLYTCQVATTGSTERAAVTAAMAAPTTPTTSQTPTPTNTTPTPTTPRTTHTVEVTVTKTSKVEKTPEGGVATGGGGDAGPDGRMFVLTGTVLILGAAAGGLVLRRRRLARG